MPQLGETVTEGTITRWFKQVGETIAADEPLFEVSTDKVDSEVPAPAAGVISEILVPEGDTVTVGARLAVISDSASSGGGAAAAPATSSPVAAPEAAPPPAVTSTPTPIAAPPPPPGAAPTPAPTPVAPAAAAEPSIAGSNGGGIVTSPLVRRMIAEQGLDPAQIHGTGEGGRITRNDVVEASRGQGGAVAQPPRTPAPATEGPQIAEPPGRGPTVEPVAPAAWSAPPTPRAPVDDTPAPAPESEPAPESAPAPPPSPSLPLHRALFREGWPLIALTGLILIVSGLFALILAATVKLLPYDVHYLGVTVKRLCELQACRIVHFMAHDRVSFGGSIISIGAQRSTSAQAKYNSA